MSRNLWHAKPFLSVVGVGVLLLILAACNVATGGGDDGDAAPNDVENDSVESVDLDSLDFSTAGWTTDFSKAAAPLAEFHSGGPPRDGIPPIDDPTFVGVGDEPIADQEPVIAVELDSVARAYPLQILTWHEIVNDRIGDTPLAVTFCPLCHTAVVFDRTVDGEELTFGTTGNLRFSDLVMWDRQTETWWQQFSGEAVVGELVGEELLEVPSQLISMADFTERFPDGEVLSRETGHDRPYGSNPYTGYDDVNQPPFALQDVELDGRLSPKARVVSIQQGDALVAVPFDLLEDEVVLNETVVRRPVVLWWREGTTSALGADQIADSRDVGSVVVYERRAGGQVLTFSADGDVMVDAETGSRWNVSGTAVSGPLRGERLKPVVHDTPFWFAVGAFHPDARIVTA
jgi:hypothetical protein